MTDDQLIKYIQEHPGQRFGELCEGLGIAKTIQASDATYETAQARALRNQLQRLCKSFKLRTTQGQRWEVR